VVPASTEKIDQLKAIIISATSEVQLTLKGIQSTLADTESSKVVVEMVQLVKDLKAGLEKM
jgi:hypothetical protein